MSAKNIMVFNIDGYICYHCRSADGIKGISVDDNPEHSIILCSKCRKELLKKLNESENGNNDGFTA